MTDYTSPNTSTNLQDSIDRSNRSLLALAFMPILAALLLVFYTENSNLLISFGYLATIIALATWVWKNSLATVKEMLRFKPFNIFLVLGAFVLVKVASTGIVAFLEVVFPQSLEMIEGVEVTSIPDIIFFVTGSVVLAPIIEEFVFRGAALQAYKLARSTTFAIFFTSILFSMLHGSLGHALAVFPLGFLAALLTLKTKQLWPAITLHALNNFLALVIPLDNSDFSISVVIAITGLVLAIGCLFVAWRWLKPPNEEPNAESEQPKPRVMFWTRSLIGVVVVYSIFLLISIVAPFIPGAI